MLLSVAMDDCRGYGVLGHGVGHTVAAPRHTAVSLRFAYTPFSSVESAVRS